MYRICILLTVICFITSCKSNKQIVSIGNSLEAEATLVYQDSFESDLTNWQVEQMTKGKAEVKDEKLEITDVSGCTIWHKKPFNGPIMITYDVVIIENGGPNDRVSDLNCFWMAQDLENPTNIFKNSAKRGGKFSNYDSLRLYYMGVGGHDNTKTRFRRYVGDGDRPLLPEHDLTDAEFLLQPNTPYSIKIIAFDGVIQYYRNDKLFVSYEDSKPYTSGYFGFRTVNNHMTVDNFKVYRLQKKERLN